MRRLILGTAGHIDHGKTALVKALTGVDTDRLKEEKERGITVDLGFAQHDAEGDVQFGVVDVPGHEGFIRNMVAGATGMDLVLLVVAADEGPMPQTREHLAIIDLLGVPRLAVAITKADLVESEWMELVEEEVYDLLEDTRFAGAPVVPVSVVTGQGIGELNSVLARLGGEAEEREVRDVVRLPMDRVFTIRGAGTIVTGTLWSGTLVVGQRALVLPGQHEARIRSLQLHGEDVDQATAGSRVAVGLAGTEVDHHRLSRGQTLVDLEGWEVSWMLTTRMSILPNTGWRLEQGQRVRVHLGTAEVLARAALLESEGLEGGEEGWVQLRLEEPLLARVRDHLVIRSYSPVTTMGGGRVAEVFPRKRRTLGTGGAALLTARLDDAGSGSLSALLELAAWRGVDDRSLPQRTGAPPAVILELVRTLESEDGLVRVNDRMFSTRIREEGRERVRARLRAYHDTNPLKPGMPLEELRQVLPGPFGSALAEALLKDEESRNRIRVRKGVAALSDFAPFLSRSQQKIRDHLARVLEEAGLSPPRVTELVDLVGAGGEEEVEAILGIMAAERTVVGLDTDFFVDSQVLGSAGARVVEELGGRKHLGPSDFKSALPVSRRHLLPLLRYFDLVGITTRLQEGRDVADSLPPDWKAPRASQG